MFEFTRNFYGAAGEFSGGIADGQIIIIPEQTVLTRKSPFMVYADAVLTASKDVTFPLPDNYLIIFDGTEHNAELKSLIGDLNNMTSFYIGERGEDNKPSFLNYPFYLDMGASTSDSPHLITPESDEHTIEVIATSKKSTPKVFTFPKGRTIVSELSRLNKAFGTVSKKKTIIGQLSDIADAAEAGRIGGGSGGALMVHENSNALDKTWQEIHDALKTTSVCIITGNNDEKMLVGTEHRITLAYYSNNKYRVRTDNSKEFTTDSSDGYPKSGSPK